MPRRIVIFLLTLFFALPLTAQDNSGAQTIFSSELLNADNKIPIGEYGTLVFRFAGGDVDMPAQIPAEGLEISHSQKHSNFSDVNGVSTFVTTHFYRVRGTELGQYRIPSVSVPFKGSEVSTQPIVVAIHERDDSDAANASRSEFGKLELDKTEFYVNEIVPFTMTGYVRGRNSINDVVRAQLEHESFIFKGFRNVRTNASEIGNTLFSHASLPSTFFALKPGEHRLGPGMMAVRVLESGGGRGLSAFFARTSLKELATNTVTTTVKPLPEGAPASFTGGVGVFLINAKPSTTELNVGDPISMDFEVTGVGNLRTMSAPVFSSTDENWKTFDPAKTLTDEEDSDGIEPGTVRFSQVIIPEFDATEIPSFELTYFNPINAEYVTLKTDPIPITVSDDGSTYEVLEEPLNVSSNNSESSQAADRPAPAFEDMLHIRLTSPRWMAEISPGKPGTLYLVVQVAFSIAFCTIVGFGLFRWIKRHQLRINHPGAPTTFKQSLKRIPKAGAPRKEFYHAVSTSLSLWQKENTDAPPPVQDLIDKITRRCETFLYSGESTSDAPIDPDEAGELHSILRRLQTQ
ncbi:MAG: BatD family protein [Verrucomicrobiales bacterium]|nr:BatD family protein [Verrucomicrobiales bacterium]